VEPKLELISGTFGRGEGRYHEGVFALPNRERRSIASVARIEVDTSLEGNSCFGKALKNAFDFGVTGTVVGVLAAPAAIASGPFGLTIGAIAAGIGLFGGGRERISIIHLVFEDGADLVAIADAKLGPFLARERSLLGRQKNTPALAAPPAPPPALPAPQAEPAGEETVAVLWSAETVKSGVAAAAGLAGRAAATAVNAASSSVQTATSAFGDAWSKLRKKPDAES
jgi:hypothetical protein